MSGEGLKLIVRRWYDVLNGKDWADQISPFFANQDFAEEWKAGFREFRSAFSDYHFTINRLLEDGEFVSYFGTAEGTHVAEYPAWELRGIPPTGKKLSWDEAGWVQIVDGRFVDGILIVDGVDRLQQMGVLPMPEEKRAEG